MRFSTDFLLNANLGTQKSVCTAAGFNWCLIECPQWASGLGPIGMLFVMIIVIAKKGWFKAWTIFGRIKFGMRASVMATDRVK